MAKMFYTMDETKAALGLSEDDIKQLSRDGKLREFRDGPRLMFKADQVEALKGEAGGTGSDQIGLSAGDTHTPLGLMDSKSGSGTAAAMDVDKDGTGAGMDVGLSGSLSGSVGGGSLAGGTVGNQSRGGKQGVNVFGEGEGDADPMAQTHMTAPKDQISLEGVGSGSGLLDLTRETDDTSLGAALLDEISPGGKRTSPNPAAGGSSSGSTAGMTSISSMDLPNEPVTSGAPMYGSAPIIVEADDPVAPAFGAMSIAATLVVLFAGFVMINAVVSDSMVSGALDFLKDKNAPYIVLGVGVLLAIIFFFAGLMAGKRGGATV